MGSRIIFIACIIALFAGGRCQAEEKKEPTPFLTLDKIIVTPSRTEEYYRESTANVSMVDEAQISESGAADTAEVLDSLPSVDVIDYGAYGSTKSVHMRGVSNNQIVTMVDGRPLSTPRDGVTDYNKIPLNNIERIEIVRGPASSIYGANAVGGVINIITKSGKEKMFTELNMKTGSYFTRMVDFANGWKIKNADYFISNNYIESDGFRDNSDYRQDNYNVKFGYDLNKANRIAFGAGYVSSQTGTPGPESNPDPDAKQQEWENYLDLTWEGSCWQDSKILLKLYQNIDRLEFMGLLSSANDKATHKTKVYGLDLQLSQIWLDIFRVSLGANGQGNYLDSTSSGKHSYDFKAGYAETSLNLLDDALTLKAGARIDDYSNFGSRASPSASFSWWFFDKIKAHGLAAQSFRAPTFNDLYWPTEDWGGGWGVAGNPNLKPERAVSHEIGLGAFLFGRIEADATYFYTRFRDMIAWASADEKWWTPSNVGTAVTKGVETNLNYQINKNLKLDFSYTRLSAIDEATKKWLIYRPRHQYKSGINCAYGKLNWYLSGRYETKRYTTDTNSKFLKSYFVADTSLSYKIVKSADITLTVNNIFDRDYQEEAGYPMPGTNFLVGAKFQF